MPPHPARTSAAEHNRHDAGPQQIRGPNPAGTAPLVTGGAAGVESLLRWYEAELRRALHLCGTAGPGAVGRDLVRRAPGTAHRVPMHRELVG